MKDSNILWTTIFVRQLEYLGIEHAIICAGSRSTPLTLAFSQNKKIQTVSQVDERSGAYFALGISKISKKPAVIISTSGTAGANFYPAILEAKNSSLPLIAITADRPHELRNTGANQTMDQVKLFGDNVNWFVDLMPPYSDTSEVNNNKNLSYIQQIAAQSVEKAMYPQPGPVHINFPFRKPLEPKTPTALIEDIDLPDPISISYGETKIPKEVGIKYGQMMTDAEFVLIIAGPNASSENSLDILNQFLEKLNCIALLDPLSGYRYQIKEKEDKGIICSYDLFLRDSGKLPLPDMIIQIGDMPISKNLNIWLSQIQIPWIQISEYTRPRDAVLKSTMWIRSNLEALLPFIQDGIQIENSVNMDSWIAMEQDIKNKVAKNIQKYSSYEPTILRKVFNYLPQSTVFVANSLLPRHLDEFVYDSEEKIEVFCNRGISGIDGTLSTSLGIASISDQASFLLTGDLAFYHDMNGLLAMMRYNLDLKIIIFNNSGGAIFDRLPIREFEPDFEEFFLTSHNLQFDKIADQFQIPYTSLKVDENGELQEMIIKKFINQGTRGILEIHTRALALEEIRSKLLTELNS